MSMRSVWVLAELEGCGGVAQFCPVRVTEVVAGLGLAQPISLFAALAAHYRSPFPLLPAPFCLQASQRGRLPPLPLRAGSHVVAKKAPAFESVSVRFLT